MTQMEWLEHKNVLITAGKDRALKFWKIPDSWVNKDIDMFAKNELRTYKDSEAMQKILTKYTQNEESDDELNGWDL